MHDAWLATCNPSCGGTCLCCAGWWLCSLIAGRWCECDVLALPRMSWRLGSIPPDLQLPLKWMNSSPASASLQVTSVN